VTKRGFYTFARKTMTRATDYQVVFGPVDVTKVLGDLFCGGDSDAPSPLCERDLERDRQQHRPGRRPWALVEVAWKS